MTEARVIVRESASVRVIERPSTVATGSGEAQRVVVIERPVTRHVVSGAMGGGGGAAASFQFTQSDVVLGRSSSGSGIGEEIPCNAFGRSLLAATVAAGSLLFAASASAVGTDVDNLFWDATNKRLGVRTAAPDAPFEVTGDPLNGKVAVFHMGAAPAIPFAFGWSDENTHHRLRSAGGANDSLLLELRQPSTHYLSLSGLFNTVYGASIGYATGSVTPPATGLTVAGPVLIGTTTDDGVNKLQVAGSAAVGTNIYLGVAGSGGTTDGVYFDTSVGNVGARLFRFRRSGVSRFDFGYDGALDTFIVSDGAYIKLMADRSGHFAIYSDYATAHASVTTAATLLLDSNNGDCDPLRAGFAGGSSLRVVWSGAVPVNYVAVSGGSTTNPVTVAAAGSDANISITLTPKGTGVLAQRNGTNAQQFWVYDRYDTAADYRVVRLFADGTNYGLTTIIGGTPLGGAAHPFYIGTGTGDGNLIFQAAGGARWSVDTAGHLAPSVDNTEDFGASSLRARTAYIGTSIVLQGPTGFVNGLTLSSAAAGSLPTIAATSGAIKITSPIQFTGFGDMGDGIEGGMQFRGSEPQLVFWKNASVAPMFFYSRTTALSGVITGRHPGTGSFPMTTVASVGFQFDSTAGASSILFTGAQSANTLGPVQFGIVPVDSAVNYLQASGAVTGSGPVLAAAGSDANISILITPKGTGGVMLPAGAAGSPALAFGGAGTTNGFYSPGAGHLAYTASGDITFNLAALRITAHGSAYIGWASGTPGTQDTALYRNAAGVVEINNNTAGQFRDLKLRNLLSTEYIEGAEMTAPAAPAANGYRLFAQDNGAGKTQLMVLFGSGAAQQVAIEP
jgi:hypothetical protein